MTRYAQTDSEKIIANWLNQKGYSFTQTTIEGRSAFEVQGEQKAGRIIVKQLQYDQAYANSDQPPRIYKIDAFQDEEHRQWGVRNLDFVIGYNPHDESFACVPIAEFDRVRSVVIKENGELRTEYYCSWDSLDVFLETQQEEVGAPFPNKGIMAMTGYTQTILQMLKQIGDGLDGDQLKKHIQASFPSLKDNSARTYASLLLGLNLAERKGNLWIPTKTGSLYRDSEDVDVLKETLLTKFASVYKIIWELKQAGELKRDTLLAMLKEYLQWNTDFGPSAQIRWCEAFNLIQEGNGGMYRLTSRGKEWANDVNQPPAPYPAPNPVPQVIKPVPEDTSTNGANSVVNQNRSFTFAFEELAARVSDMKLIYGKDMLARFHAGLHALPHKHFVILSGISGTGKTKLVQAYAGAVFGTGLQEDNPNLLVCAVQPQWNDSTSLLGYYSPVTGQYYQTAFLSFIRQALKHEQEGIPYFVCLDEMNLAVVEHYFSDFLSAWESGTPIELHASSADIGVPGRIHIPQNLYVVGTVNVDESTHPFSKKVLDRAFVLDLSEVDYQSYLAKNAQHSRLIKLVQVAGEALQPFHLHVGYRALDEMCAYLQAYPLQDDLKAQIDGLLLQKVLPRVGGDERILPALQAIRDEWQKELGSEAGCVQRLDEMMREIEHTGMCQFWR